MDTTLQKVIKLEARVKKLEAIVLASEKDIVFDEVVILIKGYDFVSTSLLQRRFSLGYARAARLLDQLEESGYVSKGEGSKPRKVLKK